MSEHVRTNYFEEEITEDRKMPAKLLATGTNNEPTLVMNGLTEMLVCTVKTAA
jgi:hypothetical protein